MINRLKKYVYNNMQNNQRINLPKQTPQFLLYFTNAFFLQINSSINMIYENL